MSKISKPRWLFEVFQMHARSTQLLYLKRGKAALYAGPACSYLNSPNLMESDGVARCAESSAQCRSYAIKSIDVFLLIGVNSITVTAIMRMAGNIAEKLSWQTPYRSLFHDKVKSLSPSPTQ